MLLFSLKFPSGEWIPPNCGGAPSACEVQKPGVKGPLGLTLCHRAVWALARTCGVSYFYNVIIPPPATTLLNFLHAGARIQSKAPLTQTQHSINNGEKASATHMEDMDTQQDAHSTHTSFISAKKTVYFS